MTGLVHAAVEQARDLRVLKPGQDLPLGAEATEEDVALEAGRDTFESDLLLELAVHTFGQKHRAHAAAADFADQPVRPDALALDARGGGSAQVGGRAGDNRLRPESGGRGVRQEPQDLVGDRRVELATSAAKLRRLLGDVLDGSAATTPA